MWEILDAFQRMNLVHARCLLDQTTPYGSINDILSRIPELKYRFAKEIVVEIYRALQFIFDNGNITAKNSVRGLKANFFANHVLICRPAVEILVPADLEIFNRERGKMEIYAMSPAEFELFTKSVYSYPKRMEALRLSGVVDNSSDDEESDPADEPEAEPESSDDDARAAANEDWLRRKRFRWDDTVPEAPDVLEVVPDDPADDFDYEVAPNFHHEDPDVHHGVVPDDPADDPAAAVHNEVAPNFHHEDPDVHHGVAADVLDDSKV